MQQKNYVIKSKVSSCKSAPGKYAINLRKNRLKLFLVHKELKKKKLINYLYQWSVRNEKNSGRKEKEKKKERILIFRSTSQHHNQKTFIK